MTDFLLLECFCSMYQHSIPFYIQIIFHRYTVFICWWPLGFFPSFWLLQIMLLWNFRIFSVNMCFLGVRLGLVDHVVTLRVTILGTAKLFFKVAAPFLFLPSVYEGFIFSISLLTFVIVCLFKIVLILVMWSCVSLWFCLAFHCWLILSSFLSCAYWPFIPLLGEMPIQSCCPV